MIRMVSKTADVLADEHIETTEIVTHHSPDFGVTKLFWYGPPASMRAPVALRNAAILKAVRISATSDFRSRATTKIIKFLQRDLWHRAGSFANPPAAADRRGREMWVRFVKICGAAHVIRHACEERS